LKDGAIPVFFQGVIAMSFSESVGSGFSNELLQAARDKTLATILAAANLVKPEYAEAQTKKDVATIQSRLGGPKSWHPAQIRFGENTLLPFGAKGIDNNTVRENDIFFIDIGPIFDGHEGDVGRTFSIGDDPEMKKCCEDVERIWQEVRSFWWHSKATGPALYDFARRCATERGWLLTLDEANGHRIADFPHAARQRGSIEGWTETPQANRWILEIQIRHPTRSFGAFFEDLLS
jgi:Xaa-Pro aminopeptidase